jgi:predicted acylesterase/phospholipase RssA
VVLGTEGLSHVPISKAVQASTAVPGLYQPVDIEGRVCVDGVLLKTLHGSIALEHGADLLFLVNPLVPMNTGTEDAREALGRRAVQKGGLPTVLAQAFRIIIHSRVALGLERYSQIFPGADMVLFEPEPTEHRLFTNLFRFHSRRKVCEIAYDQTRKDLWRRRKELEPILARNGLALRRDILMDPNRSVWDCTGRGKDREAAVADVLEAALRSLEASLEGTAPGK